MVIKQIKLKHCEIIDFIAKFDSFLLNLPDSKNWHANQIIFRCNSAISPKFSTSLTEKDKNK